MGGLFSFNLDKWSCWFSQSQFLTLKGQSNTFTRFISACQIIVISPLTKSKHLNNNKALILISSKTFSLLKSKITKNDKQIENKSKMRSYKIKKSKSKKCLSPENNVQK